MAIFIRDVPAQELRFDPDNPRLWFRDPRPTTQDDIMIALAGHGKTIMESISYGLYTAAEPLLVYPGSDGLTVVDGNLRLFAIRTLADPPFAARVRQLAPTLNPPHIDDETAAAIRSVTVAEFATWDEAYPIRLHRQSLTGRRWQSPYTSAHDFRRLSEQQVPRDRIAAWYHLHLHVIHQQIQALNVFQQLGLPDPPDWRRRHEFSTLSNALEMPNVRRHLGITDPAEAENRQPPLADDQAIQRARQLLTILHGDDASVQNGRHPAIGYRDGSMDALNRIYGDPKALDRLLGSPTSSVHDITRWMDGIPDPYRIRDISAAIHAIATRQLKSLKDEQPEIIPHPGDVSVARTAYSTYNDGSAQYIVTLLSRTPELHQHVPAALRELITAEGYDCYVEIP